MRKRSVIAFPTYVLAGCVAALLVTACKRSPSEDATRVTAVSRPMVGGASTVDAGVAIGAPPPPAEARRLAPTARERGMMVQTAGNGQPDRAFTSSLLPAGIDPTGAMLVRHGQASVEVRQVDDAMTKVRQAATQFGGFVANTSFTGGREQQRAATLEIRVPAAQFDALLSALSALGKVESVSASVEDVADEYVDLGARLANARRVESRLVEMLASRTGKLSEVLSVEQELGRVREEIERYDARLKWLERRTALSSLDVTIHEPVPLIDRRPGPGPLAEAFAEAWMRAVGVLAWCIAALGVLLPVAAVGAAAVALGRRLLRPGTPPGVSGA